MLRGLGLSLAVSAAVAAPAAADPTVTEYGLPGANTRPWGLTATADALWLAGQANPGSVTRRGPDVPTARYVGGSSLGASDQQPTAVVADAAGAVWYTKLGGGGLVGRIADGRVTEWNLPGTGNDPSGIAAEADGHIWVAVRGAGEIGRLNPATDGWREYALPAGQAPEDVAVGQDGSAWFTAGSDPGAIGRVTPTGTVQLFTAGLTPDSAPREIVAGPDGAMWFTEYAGDRIGRIAADGTIAEFPLRAGARPTGIAVGGDGNLWFAERGVTGRIGRITRAGLITEYGVGLTDTRPSYVAQGPDGNVWFTENADPGRLGRITVGPAVRSDEASAVTATSALLSGAVRPNSQPTEYRFEYGTTSDYGATTAPVSAGAGAGETAVSVPVDGLAPDTTYVYRLVAVNGTEEVASPARSFHTAPAPVAPAPAPAPQPAPAAPAPPAAAPTPVLGKTVAVKAEGTVLVRLPGAAAVVRLDGTGSIPVGAVVDARRGSVRLTSALDREGHEQAGTFWGGAFQLRQPRGGKGMVELALRGPVSGCAKAPTARIAAKPKTRRLWGRDHGGRYRTRGSNAVATVRGTRWLVEDRCDGTLTRVTQGRVEVRDLVRRRTVTVRAGHRYLAKAKPAR